MKLSARQKDVKIVSKFPRNLDCATPLLYVHAPLGFTRKAIMEAMFLKAPRELPDTVAEKSGAGDARLQVMVEH